MITILTPTTRRPFAFSLLERYMRRQTYKGEFQWLVAGDDHTGYSFTMGQEVIQTVPGELHSVCVNYAAMIPHVRGDKILCMEDDDHYHETWVEFMDSALDRAPLVGVNPALYYHVPSRRYRVLSNYEHASLASTGFTRELLRTFEIGCQGICGPFIDGFVWLHWAHTMDKPSLLLPNQKLQIGLKGVDVGGVGLGHHEPLPHPDPDGVVLRDWVGADAAGWYYPS